MLYEENKITLNYDAPTQARNPSHSVNTHPLHNTYELYIPSWHQKKDNSIHLMLWIFYIIASLHKGGVTTVSGKRHREWRRRGVYMSSEPTLHALNFQVAQA